MDFTVSTLALEAFLLVVARSAGFCATAPLLSHKSINSRLKVLIAACISISVYSSMDIALPEYETVLGFSFLILKELAVGLSLGFISSITMTLLVMAGEFIDREIGFTMATTFDSNIGASVTITAELYDKLVYVVILITNLHFYIITALAQSFLLIPVGRLSVNMTGIATHAIRFMGQYFSIGFRIAMPIFLGATIINVILGVLTKSSPQMNMFSIGIQIKVLGGLLIMTIAILFVPNIANFLMERMQEMLRTVIGDI
ncbi:MAG: flagellar biosynthetic protein FliR [Lachnospiraceae bacterium]|nr:flagellar biosynthetic protein FliR [Lachnospiraceae bacterium]